MAEEVSTTSVQTAAPTAEAPSIVVPEGSITTLEEKGDIKDTRESLFGDEKRLSEAELTGEETAEEKPAAPGTKDTVTSPPAGEPGKEAALTPEQEAAAKAAAEDADKDPVVKATEGIRRELVEERNQRRTVTQQLEAAQQTINELRAAMESGPAKDEAPRPLDKFKDFRELPDEEFEELVTTDYAEAQKYIKKLADYREAKRADADMQRQRRTVAEATQRQIATIINTSREAMAKEVPGLYDKDSDVNDKLMAFAETNGMDVDLLVALTDPGTYVVERGAKTGKYVGGGAVTALRFLNNLYQAETKMEARLREEITNELVTKFKIDAGVFRSLGDNPAATTTPVDTGGVITEDNFRTMSKEDERRALGG